jgi:hypothetical protein
MRKFALTCAILAAAVPAAAWADNGCPDKVTPDLITGFGDPVGWLQDGQTVHQPTGVTILGAPVSYVVVTREAGKDTIEEIDYRFGGVTRKYTERYPLDLRKAFDGAYAGARCAGDKVTSCAVAFQATSSSSGRLAGVELGEGPADVPASAHGPAIAQVKADYASDDQGPVFLACLYDTGG